MLRNRRVPAGLLLFLFVCLTAHHLSKGFYHLAVEQPPTALPDFYWRRVDNAYFLDRVPPQSQNFAYLSKRDPALRPLAVHADFSEPHGSDNFSGLPPWTYLLQLGIYLPTSDRFARIYLAMVDAAALGIMAWLAYDESRRRQVPPAGRAVAVLAILAIGATNEALSDGQTSLVINAGLAAAFLALRRPPNRVWDIIGGIGLSIALIKPTLGLLFLLPALARRRFILLATCVIVVAGAWLASAWWVHLSPLFQLEQFEQATRLVIANRGANVLVQALGQLMSPQLARNTLGLAGVVIAAAGVYRLRVDLAATFAFVAIVSRLYTYHGSYDDVLLAFLVIHLSTLAWRTDTFSRQAMMLWLGVGVSLWLPYSLYVSPAARWAQSLCWLIVAWYLLVRCGPTATDTARLVRSPGFSDRRRSA
jgi:hypothetical protein